MKQDVNEWGDQTSNYYGEVEDDKFLGICINSSPQYVTWGSDRVNSVRDLDQL